MANDGAPTSQMKVFADIVNHLKNYPFLLVAIATLIVFSGAFVLDIAKIKELKLLLTIIVIVSLVFQFYLMLKRQGHELDDVRFVLTLVLQTAERKHLRNLATGGPQNYEGRHTLRAELRRLRTLGLIESLPNRQIGAMKDNLKFDLKEFVRLTNRGRQYVERLEEYREPND